MSSSNNIKSEIHQYLLTILRKKIDVIEKQDKEASMGAQNETKSSSGDKYETARAMMYLEKERLAVQMEELRKIHKTLRLIDPTITCKKGKLGALVFTSWKNFFIAAPMMGEHTIGQTAYLCISPVSPIGRILMGAKETDVKEFRGEKLMINKIL